MAGGARGRWVEVGMTNGPRLGMAVRLLESCESSMFRYRTYLPGAALFLLKVKPKVLPLPS